MVAVGDRPMASNSDALNSNCLLLLLYEPQNGVMDGEAETVVLVCKAALSVTPLHKVPLVPQLLAFSTPALTESP